MKKILFYILSLLAVYFFFEIAKILIYDFDRLTNYGTGYFVGKIILFFTSAFLAYMLWKQIKLSKKKS